MFMLFTCVIVKCTCLCVRCMWCVHACLLGVFGYVHVCLLVGCVHVCVLGV